MRSCGRRWDPRAGADTPCAPAECALSGGRGPLPLSAGAAAGAERSGRLQEAPQAAEAGAAAVPSAAPARRGAEKGGGGFAAFRRAPARGLGVRRRWQRRSRRSVAAPARAGRECGRRRRSGGRGAASPALRAHRGPGEPRAPRTNPKRLCKTADQSAPPSHEYS